jgi:hypothetical protein
MFGHMSRCVLVLVIRVSTECIPGNVADDSLLRTPKNIPSVFIISYAGSALIRREGSDASSGFLFESSTGESSFPLLGDDFLLPQPFTSRWRCPWSVMMKLWSNERELTFNASFLEKALSQWLHGNGLTAR